MKLLVSRIELLGSGSVNAVVIANSEANPPASIEVRSASFTVFIPKNQVPATVEEIRELSIKAVMASLQTFEPDQNS